MSKQLVNITTPVGRLVGGNPFEARTEDYDGNPLVIKSGPNKGQPTQQYLVSIAIRKDDPQWPSLWAQIHAVGRAAFPNFFDANGAQLRSDFSWKYVDGDSKAPNKKMNIPCEKEGYPGHHVLSFSSSYAPKIYHYGKYNEEIKDPALLRTGYYVRIGGTVVGNDNDNNPGVYLNLGMIELCGYGPEIVFGVKPQEAFAAPMVLPPGASAIPTGAQVSTTTPAAPGVAVTSSAPTAPMAPPMVPGQVPPPAPDFLKPPVARVPQKVMTAAAGGGTYEQHIAQGWTDELLVQHGKMIIQ